MRKSLSRQPYSGNPTVRDDNGGFENRVLRNKNVRSKSIQTSVRGMFGNRHSYRDPFQEAVYIAQMDFRFDLGLSWELRQLTTGKQIFIKLILPAGTQEEVAAFLDEQGIFHEYLFPPTIFDERPMNF